ncbi:MAG: hypothetical protein Q8P18_16715 [Pseudomonadota bacterium]|nr:hypothetical protein [Pseudomonadota bacterium]
MPLTGWLRRWGWLLLPVVMGVVLALGLIWAGPGYRGGYSPF